MKALLNYNQTTNQLHISLRASDISSLAYIVLIATAKDLLFFYWFFITGPPNRSVLFCLLASVVVCNAAGGWASRRAGGRWAAAGPAAWAVGRPTPHGGPVRLRLVRSTPCYFRCCWEIFILAVTLSYHTDLITCILTFRNGRFQPLLYAVV